MDCITSRANPLLVHLRRLGSDAAYRRKCGQFLGDGPKLLQEALMWKAELVSVVSLFVEGEEARFRKFATEPGEQGRGIGSALLRHIMKEAAGRGARRLWCDARQEKAGFYQKFGFSLDGSPFYKGPIPYVRMSCALPEAAR